MITITNVIDSMNIIIIIIIIIIIGMGNNGSGQLLDQSKYKQILTKGRNIDNYGTKVTLYEEIEQKTKLVVVQRIEPDDRRVNRIMDDLNIE